MLRLHGIMRRTVKLDKEWYKDAIGAMIGVRKADGAVVSLLPAGISGYTYFDEEKGKRVRINSGNQELFEEEAIAFYTSFPLKRMTIKDLVLHIAKTLSVSDIVLYGLAVLAATLIGLLTPKLSNLVFSDVLESDSLRVLMAVAVFMVCVSVSRLFVNSISALLMARINTKMNLSVEAATMMRLLSLPAGFFKEYSSGELSSRAGSMSSLCSMLVSAVLSSGLTSVFSLVYITQIFAYAPALLVPALAVILATIVVSLITTLVQTRVTRRMMEIDAKESGIAYSLISGVQKIKLSGAEKRAFAKWAGLSAASARLEYDPPLFLKLNAVINLMITLTGTLVMYYLAVISGTSVADYFAFNSAYGMVAGAFMGMAGIAMTMANIKPVLDMVKPILTAVPEISEG